MSRLLFLICASTLSAQPVFLLPDGVTPKKHIVELTVDPDLDTFTGWVRIEVELAKPANVLWVNAKDLIPRETSVLWQGHSLTATPSVDGGEFIGVHLASPVGPGPATISIRYRGKLDEAAVAGPYRNKVAGEWYAFTTFTPIDARRAFPCFDEPRFKTPWEISIHVKRGDKAFSNAPQIAEIDEPGGKLIRFATTQPLPAEVVAFCVGPFDVYEGSPAGHGTPIRIISARGQREQSRLAAQATVDVLPRLEDYTGIQYPFGKLDHVAVPEFKFGAVENPGLITYKASALLQQPNDVEAEKARRIRGLQAHEMGHQWFGDLVTQATWDDVWLSEGFATWFSAKVMDQEQPAARRLLASVAARERIMVTDAGPKTRPVRLEMHSRKETDGVYSQFVYQKGAAILMMLDGWLGEARVRDGLRAYLKAHQFGNASTADLEASLPGSKPVLDGFLNQTGIPSIRVKCGDAKLVVEQTNASHNWNVPVCWRGAGMPPVCSVVGSARAETRVNSCPAWIYPNSGGTGYFRTEWSAEHLTALDLSQLSAAERLTLIYDLRAAKNITAPVLRDLAGDAQPEVAKAAADVMAGK
ncbi:MAG TPA: M1 family aminopeptidase [Bryobacteraceae bacterium]|nr:M1 family aminopeptidase [Bryobacteraceae bacterium]